MTNSEPQIIDVNEQIDAAPIGGLQLAVLGLSLIAMVLEGYDTFTVGYVGPQIAAAWNVSPSNLGILFTSGIFGSTLGYLGVGPIADHFGRRKLIILGTFAFGLITLCSVAAPSLGSFIAARVLAGLALGVVLPNVVALVAELAPLRRRSLSVVILYSGFAIGAATGGMLSTRLVPTFGWRSVFVVGGIAPMTLSLIMGWALPESVRFLALRDGGDPRLRKTMARIAGPSRIPSDARFILPGEAMSRQPIIRLFRDGRAISTLLVWLVLAMDGSSIDVLVFWIPTLTARAGVSANAGINFTVMFLLGGTLGAYAIGYFMDRVGGFRVLVPIHACAAVLVMIFALFIHAASLPLAFLLGVSLPGGTSGAQGLIARLYPTSLRTTGVGWAVGIGRLTSIVAPVFTGMLLARGLRPRLIVAAISIPVAIAAISLLGMSFNAHARRAVLSSDAA